MDKTPAKDDRLAQARRDYHERRRRQVDELLRRANELHRLRVIRCEGKPC